MKKILMQKFVSINSHFLTTNHFHDLNMQESIPLYDSYDEKVLTAIHNPK